MNRIRSHATFVLGFLILAFAACKTDRGGETATVDFKRTSNEVIVRMVGEPDHLNPALSSNNYATQVEWQLFQYLLSVDPKTLRLIPQLLHAMPQVEEIKEGPFAGGVAYDMEIHDAAIWDDGSPVTGADFIFTLKAVFNPRVPAQRYRPYLAFIKEVRLDPENPKKFTVFTDQKYILGEEAICSSIPVMPEYFYDPQGLLKDIPLSEFTNPEQVAQLADKDERLQQFAELFISPKYSREKGGISGSGPYRFEEWETGQRIVVSKKENWWGDGLAGEFPALLALPDQITFKPIPSEVTAVTALKSEEIDVVTDIDPKNFLEVKEAAYTSARYNFETPLALAYYFININLRDPKLSDKRVRQALAYATDVPEIVESVFYGFGEPTTGPVHPRALYYNDKLTPYSFNIEKARTLLNEAGWEDTNGDGIVDKEINGARVELNLTYKLTANRETSRNIGLLIQDNYRKAGIGMSLEAGEFTVIMEQAKKGDFELISNGRTISPTLWDPSQEWHTDAIGTGGNYSGFGNARTDALIEKIRATLNEAERTRLYKELQTIIHEEQPRIFLFVPTGRIAIHKRFEAETSSYYPGFFPNTFRLK